MRQSQLERAKAIADELIDELGLVESLADIRAIDDRITRREALEDVLRSLIGTASLTAAAKRAEVPETVMLVAFGVHPSVRFGSTQDTEMFAKAMCEENV